MRRRPAAPRCPGHGRRGDRDRPQSRDDPGWPGSGLPGVGVVCAAAEHLPFAGHTFSALAMSVVSFFLADPVRVLRESRRVLRPGAPVAIYTTGPELRGTPAAPERLASHGHFYSDAELAALASLAGLHDARVGNDGGGQLLTARA